jgi:2-methylfumaryl-CoA hydratase
MTSKTSPGRFFEDFRLGETIVHATPRTVSDGDVSLYIALYGPRFAIHSSSAFAAALGLPRAPLDDLLVFHLAFGKTVPDVSLNAIANLGYAAGRFGVPVYPGDTLATTSKVIGLKQNKEGATGVVYVNSVARNQRGEMVPELPGSVPAAELVVPEGLRMAGFDTQLAGSTYLWDDYETGERIDHVDGTTIEDAEHTSAARLYQNTARVHFNLHVEKGGRFGRRIVYGGHIISIARALSFNGLANAFRIAAINGGRHVAPCFAGDTVYAWSEVLERATLPGRSDIGALRLRTVATKDRSCADFPYRDAKDVFDPAVVLDFDYTVLLPRRG